MKVLKNVKISNFGFQFIEFDGTIVIVIFNHKGGTGKSFSVQQMARILSAVGWKVLVLDNDMQGNETNNFGLTESYQDTIIDPIDGEKVVTKFRSRTEYTMRDVYFGNVNPFDAIYETGYDNLHMITADRSLKEVEEQLTLEKLLYDTADVHKTLFNRMKPVIDSKAYDFIFIDCPPSDCKLVENAMYMGEHVMIPIEVESNNIIGAQIAEEIIANVRDRERGASLLGLYYTIFDSKAIIDRQFDGVIDAKYKPLVFKNKIPFAKTICKEAITKHTPLFDYNDRHTVTRSYMALTRELVQRLSDHYENQKITVEVQ